MIWVMVTLGTLKTLQTLQTIGTIVALQDTWHNPDNRDTPETQDTVDTPDNLNTPDTTESERLVEVSLMDFLNLMNLPKKKSKNNVKTCQRQKSLNFHIFFVSGTKPRNIWMNILFRPQVSLTAGVLIGKMGIKH